jgi:glycosyltransferase involved in cell wall biosynthesis
LPLISVITPASRGVKDLSNLFRDFNNQTLPKNNWEHVCIYDGKVPEDVQNLVEQYKKLYNLNFKSIAKDMGDMHRSPGTKARNYGTSIAKGQYVCFCDDDDRYSDKYLEKFIEGMQVNMITVVQMSCSEARMYKNGDPTRIKLIPEVGLHHFPIICHIGTPCFCVPIKWALEDPWRHEPEHDYRFIKRIVEKHKPLVYIKYGMQVDVDGLVTKGIKDFVSMPPYNRS